MLHITHECTNGVYNTPIVLTLVYSILQTGLRGKEEMEMLTAYFQRTSSSRFHSLHFRPKPLQCQGADLENVYQLRTPEDANCIAKLANDRNAVIVGASFIGTAY